MSKITNEQIFELLTGMQETVVEMKEDIVGIKEAQTEMKEAQTEMKEVLDGLIVKFVGLDEKLDGEIKKNIKTREEVAFIKAIIEKDAKKQLDHEIEHTSNIAAHDRFEARIVALEKSKK
jgi:hypothetical protein